ncbi:hypothetical protein WN48_10758 [Eufriesea mexicana]|uniref:Uncharacterized protein n=1 Tax=Eufriesea mexicana TaxID=516756 RepID=A0A310SFW1_9HYME|nr:PREDICTED: uncharacterized protein LOC108553003 isoform X2 [Eufriesea mexicana]OAD53129.1 hypothetical protein WN48_10758 [Eufriesea mexicana]
MARWNILYLLCLLFFANNYINYSSSTYVQYDMESEKLCQILGGKSPINIATGAATVWSKYMYEQWKNVRSNIQCKFKFTTAKGFGLFAVIQKMSFRRNGTQCIDYVQFMRKDHHRTEKFCGSLDRSKIKYYVVPEPEDSVYSSESQPLVRTYAEYDPSDQKSSAELETEIFISKQKLHEGEFLALGIAYTTFTNCSNVDMNEYKSIGHNACMPNRFFCDGIYNCVPAICFDEDKCSRQNEIISNGTGAKVKVGAVITLILCLTIFVMCLWIYKRSQKLCWSMDCVNPNACPRPAPLPIILHEYEGSVIPSMPSAPMLEVAVPSSVADKNLPPSYDSLFPEHSNSIRS